jgi:ATP-binding cassette subfamily F protein uup
VNLVSLERVVKGYGQRTLLNGVFAGLASGDRVGVVGRNGAGKSTLLALLAGAERPDQGRVSRARGLRAGHLPQQGRLAGTVATLVAGGRPEHALAADPRFRAVSRALLAGIDLHAPVQRLSGGEARRVALASLLAGEHDLLLLDEPTNHLDLDAVNWLAGFLRELPATLVVVTHDRWFLDEVTARTWELDGGELHAYDGGYAAWVLARAERERLASAASQRRRILLRKELAWLRRGPPARASKPKFRLEAANALIASEPPPRDRVALVRLATARLGKTVIEVSGLAARAGERVLFAGVTWQLGPGERVGLLGPNGSGKTTLLKVLAGLDPGLAVQGRVVRGTTVRAGYLPQEGEGLDPRRSARDALARVRGNLLASEGRDSVGSLLERLGLGGDSQWVPAGELSGGQRRRVQVAQVLLAGPNVLLLDEPTNDLDVDTLTELEDLLDHWPGSLVVASHDRYFLERVTDHVVALLGDGTLCYLGGGVAEYLARRAAAAGQRGGPPSGPAAGRGGLPPGGPPPGGPPPGGPPRRGLPSSPAAAQRAARKELARLERQLARLSAREAELAADLAGHASDYLALTELGQRLRAIQAEKEQLEERWLVVAEEASRT